MEATSEFDKHRSAIDQVASEVSGMQQAISAMTAGLRDELNQLQTKVASLQSSSVSRGDAPAGGDDVRRELDMIKAEILVLKSSDVSRGGASSGVGDGGKLGGFIPWKTCSQNHLAAKKRSGETGSMRSETTWTLSNRG